jgi:hypothetical protein
MGDEWEQGDEQDDGLIREPSDAGTGLPVVSGGMAGATAVDSGDETPDEAPDSGTPPDSGELEDTIRQIIREELAGDMGQRLSQNIRRMIRDEIAVAILRRDLVISSRMTSFGGPEIAQNEKEPPP